MSGPSFSLNMSQQIVQPAESSGGVNNGNHDIYPCLLPGSTFTHPARKDCVLFPSLPVTYEMMIIADFPYYVYYFKKPG